MTERHHQMSTKTSTATNLPVDGESDEKYVLAHQEQDRFFFVIFVSDGMARNVHSSNRLLKTIQDCCLRCSKFHFAQNTLGKGKGSQ